MLCFSEPPHRLGRPALQDTVYLDSLCDRISIKPLPASIMKLIQKTEEFYIIADLCRISYCFFTVNSFILLIKNRAYPFGAGSIFYVFSFNDTCSKAFSNEKGARGKMY
jgi:hypothetical protein